MVWYPGQEFGTALADVLVGRRSPGGRLPVTIAMRDEDYAGHGVTLDDELNLDYELIQPGGFGHLERNGTAARFPFGFGLGLYRVQSRDPYADRRYPGQDRHCHGFGTELR